jgi:hypothetical protein
VQCVITGEWRRLHNEGLCDLKGKPNVIQVINSRRMGWARHIARTGDRICAYRILVERPEEKRPIRRLRRRWRIILKCIF